MMKVFFITGHSCSKCTPSLHSFKMIVLSLELKTCGLGVLKWKSRARTVFWKVHKERSHMSNDILSDQGANTPCKTKAEKGKRDRQGNMEGVSR